MKQKNKAVTLHEVRLLFENKFPELLAGAVDSPDEVSFRQKIDAYLSDASWNAEGVRVVRRLLEYDGRVVHELSVGGGREGGDPCLVVAFLVRAYRGR